MRFLAIVFFVGLANAAQGQMFDKKTTEAINITSKLDSVAACVFLDSINIVNAKLVSKSKNLYLWTNFSDIKSSLQIFDIRYKFPTVDSAKWFNNEYYDVNSEYSVAIKKHKIMVAGANDLRVFSQTKYMEKFGFKDKIDYCSLFTVNNYFVKIYVSTHKKMKPKEYQFLIEAAVKRINTCG